MTEVNQNIQNEQVPEDKSPKEDIGEKERTRQESVNENCISPEPIALPWVVTAKEPEKPPKESEELAEPPEATVSDNINKRVVVELKWLDGENNSSKNGSVDPADCGIKASLTLAEADKVNEFITQMRKNKTSNVDAITSDESRSYDPTPLHTTRRKAANDSQEVARPIARKNSIPDITMQADRQLNAINSYSDDISQSAFQARNMTPDVPRPFYPDATQTYSRYDMANPAMDPYGRSINYPAASYDTGYRRGSHRDSNDYNEDLVQSALALARSRRAMKNQRNPGEYDNMQYRGMPYRRRDYSAPMWPMDASGPYHGYPGFGSNNGSPYDPYRNPTMGMPTWNCDPMSLKSPNGCENLPDTRDDASAKTSSRAARDYRTVDREVLSRNLTMPSEERVRARKATPAPRCVTPFSDDAQAVRGVTPFRGTTPFVDDRSLRRGTTTLREESRLRRGRTPFNEDTLIKRGTTPFRDDQRMQRGITPLRDDTEVRRGATPSREDTQALRGVTPLREDMQISRDSSPFVKRQPFLPEITEEHDIVDEMVLLATYHGDGVLSPLMIDDIPDPNYQTEDPRRGRSLSVMRRLLSDGEGQYTRESTPMSNLRRQFKAKMKSAGLHEAATFGDIDVVTYLITEEEDTDINSTDEFERTALHLAAERGHKEIVTLLIEQGGNVNQTDAGGKTPLHWGVESGDVDVVSALLQAGADVEVKENSRGRTPLHLATVSNSLEILKLLLQPLIDDPWEGRRIVKDADKDGRTLLHMTAHHGLQEATLLLLSAGAEVNARDFSGNTPMHAVILTRLRKKERICAVLLETLLDSGGDIEGGGGGDEGGDAGTLVHAAASVGCLDCLRVLVKRSANVEAKNFFGKTPLQIAIEENHTKTVAFLLHNDASLEGTDAKEQRPLHHAILADSPEMVEEFLVAGADSKAKDRDGKTYFQFAILKRRYQALNALVKHIVVEVDEDQQAIHYCACIGNKPAVDVLLNNGYNVNAIDTKGRTALHHAISGGHEDLVLHLLANGASTSRADDNGATPLHYAVRWGGSDALLRRLVKKQGHVNAVDRLGRTPLHYAASKSSIMSDMYILINSGAQINTKDARGLTPLHLAARLGNESLVRILLDNDAKHDIRDCDEFLPVDHAKENGHKCIIKRLDAYSIKKDRDKESRLHRYIAMSEIEQKKEEGERVKESEERVGEREGDSVEKKRKDWGRKGSEGWRSSEEKRKYGRENSEGWRSSEEKRKYGRENSEGWRLSEEKRKDWKEKSKDLRSSEEKRKYGRENSESLRSSEEKRKYGREDSEGLRSSEEKRKYGMENSVSLRSSEEKRKYGRENSESLRSSEEKYGRKNSEEWKSSEEKRKNGVDRKSSEDMKKDEESEEKRSNTQDSMKKSEEKMKGSEDCRASEEKEKERDIERKESVTSVKEEPKSSEEKEKNQGNVKENDKENEMEKKLEEQKNEREKEASIENGIEVVKEDSRAAKKDEDITREENKVKDEKCHKSSNGDSPNDVSENSECAKQTDMNGEKDEVKVKEKKNESVSDKGSGKVKKTEKTSGIKTKKIKKSVEKDADKNPEKENESKMNGQSEATV